MENVTEILGTQYPIIQGAMGVICNPELVGAVCEAGGYGILATAYQTDSNKLKEQIQMVRSITDKPFGVNLTIINPNSMDLAKIIAEYEIPAVTTSAGSPQQIVDYFKPKGIKIFHVCPTVEKAIKAENLGVDAIIAEGGESGGLQGFDAVSTMVLVPSIVDRVNIPVIAAGGIGDSRGYKAVMELGAKGVQVGTRFIATKECATHESYKAIICQASESSTILLSRKNARIRALPTPLALDLMNDPEGVQKLVSPNNVKRSWLNGDFTEYPLPAGQIIGLIHEIKTVKEIIEEMISR